MSNDPIFRVALMVSLAAHLAVMTPRYAFERQTDVSKDNPVELTYIVIEKAQLTQDEEKYVENRDSAYFLPYGQEEIGAVPIKAAEDEERETAYLKYFNLIREKIRARLHVSFDGARKGTARAVFTVSPSGRLLSVDKVTSDAVPLIKQRTIRGIEKAGPFPAFPPELGNEPLTFSLHIHFTPK